MARKMYYGSQVDVSFDLDVCTHAAECVRGMHEVFNTKARPWINLSEVTTPEAANKVREVIGRCPSGALRVEEHVTHAAEPVIRTVHNPDKSRYEGWVGDELGGFAEYQLTPELIVFTHTETEPKFEGKGIASAVVRFALDDVREAANRKVLPLCPFVKGWIDHHQDYYDLVLG
ncbi:MAG: (4Fe-4S)-binding protein [Propionibacteriaceae bacterium]|jgi:uncharacterized Fe-S cluster protein YjdI/predicted GNAT family acetyltransferase|nr:(4Fe-4S)-binding protein [Propionibacteriaceae bacterium]